MTIKILKIVLLILIMSGCSNSIKRSDNDILYSNFPINKLTGEKEIFFIFSKDSNGTPIAIVDMTSNKEVAVNYFKDPKFIKKNDCIRIKKKEETVCDKNKWFAFGKNEYTKLITRQPVGATKTVNAMIRTPGIIVFGALEGVVDVLKLNNPMKGVNASKIKLTEEYSEPIQDLKELEFVRNNILKLAEDTYLLEQSKAMFNISEALFFIKKYAKDDFSSIVDKNLMTQLKYKSHKGILSVLKELPATKKQRQKGIDALRKLHSFDGFISAYQLSESKEDISKAYDVASSSREKKIIESKLVATLNLNKFVKVKLSNSWESELRKASSSSLWGLKRNGTKTYDSLQGQLIIKIAYLKSVNIVITADILKIFL